MDTVLEALDYLDPSTLTYQEWVNVGMALKHEGFSVSLWDGWSTKDSNRYKINECLKKWNSFGKVGSPLTAGTIIQMAKDRGFTASYAQPLEWNSTIEDDGDGDTVDDSWRPTAQLKEYLQTLFKTDEYVGYVSNDVWLNDDKWSPAKGCFDRTAGELIKSLEKYPDDLGATIGDYKAECGAWIRFNPLDGKDVKNDNVTSFRFALVESDTVSIADQERIYRESQLPIAIMVHSGNKSVHAIVRIDAKDYSEYKTRVDYLYKYLENDGLEIDRQNRNPSRLSRMPGVMRNGNRQYIVAKNIGKSSWAEWFSSVNENELPEVVTLEECTREPPNLPEAIIDGVLRQSHKMIISGASKAGKSFLLMELAVAFAEGCKWIGHFDVKQCKVLYANFEIDPESFKKRFLDIYDKLGIKEKDRHKYNIGIDNLRGLAKPLNELIDYFVNQINKGGFKVLIIDPIYKIITGDENNASEMGKFCNCFDEIARRTGASVIYCHHHSKGAQGGKKSMDRASGSGVFARDPDAQLDIIQLEMSDNEANKLRDVDGATAWRMESTLREFASFNPISFWFEYPIHRVDKTLDELPEEGSFEAVRAKNPKCTTEEERKSSIDTAFQALNIGSPVSVKDIAEYLDISERCVKDRIKDMSDTYVMQKGLVWLCNEENEI